MGDGDGDEEMGGDRGGLGRRIPLPPALRQTTQCDHLGWGLGYTEQMAPGQQG